MKLIRELLEMAQAIPSLEEIAAGLQSESNAYNIDFEDMGPKGKMDISQLHDDPEVQMRLMGDREPGIAAWEMVAYNEACSSKFDMWLDGTTLHIKGMATDEESSPTEMQLEVDLQGREEMHVLVDAVCEQLDEFFAGLEHVSDEDEDGDDNETEAD